LVGPARGHLVTSVGVGIVGATPPAAAADGVVLQVGVFSATLPPEALEITRKFMNKPVRLVDRPAERQTDR
jgi:superfamily II DNA/RNA helicase